MVTEAQALAIAAVVTSVTALALSLYGIYQELIVRG